LPEGIKNMKGLYQILVLSPFFKTVELAVRNNKITEIFALRGMGGVSYYFECIKKDTVMNDNLGLNNKGD
jgi:hypothetical protein